MPKYTIDLPDDFEAVIEAVKPPNVTMEDTLVKIIEYALLRSGAIQKMPQGMPQVMSIGENGGMVPVEFGQLPLQIQQAIHEAMVAAGVADSSTTPQKPDIKITDGNVVHFPTTSKPS